MIEKDKLESLTESIFFQKEKDSLRVLASKITKLPKSINVPIEYTVSPEKKSGV